MDIQERASKYLDTLESLAAKGGNLVAEEVPEVCREVIAWQFWSHAILAAVFVTLAMVLLVTARRLYCASQDKDDISFTIAMLFIPAMVIFVVFAIFNAFDAAKARVAPRVILLEQVKKLVGR